MNINESSTSKDIVHLALAVHELVNRLPLTMRTLNSPGVRLEDGKVLDYNYSGPILEKVLSEGKKSQKMPQNGPYKDTPVVVVPLLEDDKVIAAIGVVDITQGIYSDIIEITKRPEKLKGSRGDSL
jgi:hypothetical protein